MRIVLSNRHFWLFAALCGASLAVLAAGGRPLEEAVGALVILGVVLPLLALATCWRLPAPTPPQPWRSDDAATMAILVGWIVVFLVFKGPLLEALVPASAGPAFRDTVNTALKLLAFVAVPAIVLRLRGFDWWQAGRPTAPAIRLLLCFVLLALAGLAIQYLLGSQFHRLLGPGYAGRPILLGTLLAFAWMSLEAGLVEEFFFRWYLQSRLAAWTGSQLSAALVAALVFGLAHAPGMILRGAGVQEGLGATPSIAQSLAYSIAVPGVAGLTFALLWARTRSFIPLVLLHGFIDALSNTASFMDKWQL
jgi:membrane protease YdiL (CAAX protease family)